MFNDDASGRHTPDPSPALVPLAGRRALYARIVQHISSGTDQHALLFSGHAGAGRSTFLRYFNQATDETLIGVYLELGILPSVETDSWLAALAETTRTTLSAQGLNITRLPDTPSAPTADWIQTQFLPAVATVIRAHRRLIWLIDDVERWLPPASGTGPAMAVSILHECLNQNTFLGLILGLDAAYEEQVSAFIPLVAPNAIHRLGRLRREESAELLRSAVAGVTNLDDTAVSQAHTATGGSPRLLMSIGQQLASGHDLETAIQATYRTASPDFLTLWNLLSQDEKLVLTACADLLYEDPTQSLSAQRVESWLIATDYPLGPTAIHAAIRGLEYRELAEAHPGGFALVGELWRQWLMEHARLNTASADTARRPAPVVWLIVGALIVLALVLALAQSPTLTGAEPVVAPTVTLDNR